MSRLWYIQTYQGRAWDVTGPWLCQDCVPIRVSFILSVHTFPGHDRDVTSQAAAFYLGPSVNILYFESIYFVQNAIYSPLSTTRHSYFCEIDNAPGHWNSVSPARTRVCVWTTKNLPTHWYFESLTKHGPSTSRKRPFYVWIDNNASSY